MVLLPLLVSYFRESTRPPLFRLPWSWTRFSPVHPPSCLTAFRVWSSKRRRTQRLVLGHPPRSLVLTWKTSHGRTKDTREPNYWMRIDLGICIPTLTVLLTGEDPRIADLNLKERVMVSTDRGTVYWFLSRGRGKEIRLLRWGRRLVRTKETSGRFSIQGNEWIRETIKIVVL